ncbi:DUF3604 domain-containing protein [Microbulbifer flavimaris]|uniref:DUF3604 domain-containing protein n=1 Tax=Microbulbifer flavimaris TaxID=1781068 RepID=A0ABX4HYA2_9GAMM|nr:MULTISPECIES: DUF3604 domain-containing protein [Microbulbifer]KUJ82930.1 hypothetical protein AVO43_10285 [Microbulbifer sp. ZGT114]PCO05114.1 DUF3604 domain-containing protein [Microbulbifer flavimaris]
MKLSSRLLIAICMPLAGVMTMAQDAPPQGSKPDVEYAPYPELNFPNRVFFGDTHLHTSYSTDAGMFGNTLGPDAAYRFAKGETVTSSTGVPARLHRPLDFLVVADHAENLGLAPLIEESDKRLLASEWGKQVHDLTKAGKPDEAYTMWGAAVGERENPLDNSEGLMASMWQRITKAADAHNNPGLFTALIGFEWTSSPDGNNLHRVVVFRDDKPRADQIIPLSAYDSEDPEDLWRWMANYEEKVGGRVLAIPHNGNLSNGLMFDSVTFTDEKPFDRDYAERRARWEPVYEVTQIKGDGETHPLLSPNDEFADFETWDRGSFGAAKEKDMLPREYAREALKQGLAHQKKLGANPYQFGMIGSTDSHTSLATTGEDNFFGKATVAEPSADPVRFEEKITGYLPDPEGRDYAIRHYEGSASGLAAVWARENTREALWDALARREVYATTGTRPIVRVFAGFNFNEKDLGRSDFARHGYENGVPMGGELRGSDRAPTFLVRALRDPDGANLDRIQIIKGWLDSEGKTHERIYDVAVSDDRKIGADARAEKKVGNTVDPNAATYTNTIGDPFLQAYWKDPEFDGRQNAFYYVRVLEIPTPRWTTYDAKYFGLKRPKDVPASIQERAYTSPIWYNP